MNPINDPLGMTRRYFLGECTGLSLGGLALSSLCGNAAETSTPTDAPSASGRNREGGLPSLPHFPPKVKRVIYLTQSGGPSQLELFDHKPGLEKYAGTELPESVRNGQRLTTMTASQKQLVMPSKVKFERCGKSGATIGEWLPHMKGVADDICFIKSMYTDHINHAPAMTFMLTGGQIPGRPSFGDWVGYGLGSTNRNLPDYIVLVSKMKRPSDQPLYDYYWGSGFLPSQHQGVRFRNSSEPVLYLKDPAGLPTQLRRGILDGLRDLNEKRLAEVKDPEIATRVQQYEMAYRMQTSIPELADFSGEPDETFDLYGPDARRPGSYAANCILARRLAERGVRFIQLFHPDWDHHKQLPSWCVARCRDTDQPTAALLKDLKRRGLLDDTLVIWGGEFGRSVVGQGDWQSIEAGRDHHPRCFTMWLAGGGIKPGITHGGTDEFGYNAVDKPVHVHDLQATLLHLLGVDHTRLTYRYLGRDFRLTDVHGHVVKDILA